jgi:hypothetical protein
MISIFQLVFMSLYDLLQTTRFSYFLDGQNHWRLRATLSAKLAPEKKTPR